MPEAAFPRALVITQYAFNADHGGGIALLAFFAGWPEDRIAQIHIDDPKITPDESICRRRYPLSVRELRPLWPLRLYLDRRANRLGGTPPSPAFATYPGERKREESSENGNPSTVSAPGFFSRLKDALNAALVRHGFYRPAICRITPELDAFVRDFAPGVVFSTLGDLCFCRFVSDVAGRYGVPVALQVGDDWIAHYPRNDLASFLTAPMARRALGRVLRRAAKRYVCCELMRRAYQRRYGLAFDVLITPVDRAEWFSGGERSSQTGKLRTILYAGTIHDIAQTQGLLDIAAAIETLNGNGIGCELVLATPPIFIEKYQERFRFPHCRFLSCTGKGDVVQAISEADLLVIPATFDSGKQLFMRYSMPAKMIAYMATAVPLFVYGPADSPPIMEAEEHGVAMTVTRRDSGALQSRLKQALLDEDMRKRVVSAALRRVKEKYDFNDVTDNFRRALLDIAGEKAGLLQ